MTDGAATSTRILDNLEKVMKGKRQALQHLVVALFAGGNVLLEDVPGVGKTTLAKSLAKTIGGEFKRIQFTPDLLPTDILGSSIYNPKEGTFFFKQGPVFANILLADEINRASPRTQSSLLEAMSEGQVTIEGNTLRLPQPFVVLATQNPVEFHGTYPLPEAQLDRFALKLSLGYPSVQDEIAVMEGQRRTHPLETLEPLVELEAIAASQAAVREVRLEKPVTSYIMALVQATREDPRLRLGSSPRGSLALYRTTQALAYCSGRDYGLPDDVQALAVGVLAHRLVLDTKSKYSGVTRESIIEEILGRLKVPHVVAIYVGDSLVARTLRSLFRDRLTPTGRAVFWLFMLANLTGMFSFVVKVYFVWSALGSLLLVSIVVARLSRVPLTVDVSWPARATAGARVPVKVRVTNHRRRVARDVSLKPWKLPWPLQCEPEEGASLVELKPGEGRTLSWELVMGRRGHYLVAGVRQDTCFPFGLWNDIRCLAQPLALLVYPRFLPLHRLDIPVGRRYQPGGIALTSHLGDSTEFLATREFREGDSIRMLHWRSWARIGKPVVKEFQEEFFCRIALLMDTFVPARQLKRAREVFEAAVSLAAAVADNLAREEYVIDVFAAGPEIYHFQAGRSLAYLENVMDILACIEPCTEPPFEKIEPVLLECLENITTTVVVMLDWDERRERMLQVIRDRGSGVKAILVRDEPPTRDLASLEALVGSYVWIGSEQVRSGVTEL